MRLLGDAALPGTPAQERLRHGLTARLESLDRFLTGKSCPMRLLPLCRALGNCYALGRQVTDLRPRHDRAQQILSGYAAKGRLQDQIKQFRGFVSAIREEDDGEMAAQKGYLNHLSFLELEWRRIREIAETALPDASAGRLEPEQVCSFLSRECGNVSALRDLPGARSGLLAMLAQLENGQQPDRKSIGKINVAWDELQAFGENDFRELRRVEEKFLRQQQAMQENIARAQALYAALEEVLDAESVAAFDPEGAAFALGGKSGGEIRQCYEEFLGRVDARLGIREGSAES